MESPSGRLAAGETAQEAEQLRNVKSKFKRNPREAQEAQVDHFYNAIRLTNYYTNLLNQTKTTNARPEPGDVWRTEQLAYQIPHQDIKLLASGAPSSSQQQQAGERLFCGAGSGADLFSSVQEEEIRFIRGQRKMASQYKASLYYLNPASSGAPKSLKRSAQQQEAECFKVSFAHDACLRSENAKQTRGDCWPSEQLTRTHFGAKNKQPYCPRVYTHSAKSASNLGQPV